ncbi:DUF421 domain-containing protein [Bacillus benzoevorans]|uniref:Uncharacterized membrane protein YcaP (DUF421 family) n=1 Tax=Bacillus benzoevorans TaxID=1456 RepID=A0A7X0LW10_9BACI|nr:DUF421 domain-containing protein [Bacillus benzoevorans]MBB6444839.1 uncharacterized membrane protein YcaP (DUF421 family) [Bacillus benzoevorans]
MEIVYHGIIIFISGYVLLRVTGKKAVSEMNTFDLLYIFVLTNIISSPLEEESVGKALIYAVLIVILYKIFIRLSLNNKLRWILYARPTVLIRNGDIDRKGLKKVRMPMNELLSNLRVKGYPDTQQIAMAAMEETGSISVIPKAEYRPIQPNDLNWKVKKEFLPIPLIMDGQIIYHNLKYLQLEQKWLMNEVEKRGKTAENIMLATFLEDGTLFIDDNVMINHHHDPHYYTPGKDEK